MIFIYGILLLLFMYMVYKTSKKITTKIFFLGYFFHVGLEIGIQDYYGKNAYIKYATENWMDFHWALGAFITIVTCVVYLKWYNREE